MLGADLVFVNAVLAAAFGRSPEAFAVRGIIHHGVVLSQEEENEVAGDF